ncbi:hypothetical protein EW145_g3251 [Phellinidium pouzarii]|uniref:Ribosome biogenesis protein SLX9 n=1 Tax=Phellinidium pouzarii TaxID=167371 RepID=A0A4S4L994_9AGAM|nr:hypothetical protein EW145_g3251 [Phellinidium pouzarii]
MKRLKRKEKEEIAGGFQDVALALSTLEDGLECATAEISDPDATHIDISDRPKAIQKQTPGRIGEGKGVPLSKKQRKRILKTENFRQPLLLATPEFASNPFQALRIHAQNTLVKHQLSST